MKKYDNKSYWQDLHSEYSGQLRAVGFPWLSETFNELKYKSEAETTIAALSSIGSVFKGKDSIAILDIGAGIGYWTALFDAFFKEHGFKTELTALDISETALNTVRSRHPDCRTIHEDLTTIDTRSQQARYDIVFSFYCLHHLVNFAGFLNGLQFAARSVKPGGYLLIMDPILSKPFSKYHEIDYLAWKDNGIPRPRSIIDDVLQKEGFERTSFSPAVSFILNGNIEAKGSLSFRFHRMLWVALCYVYRSSVLTKLLAKNLLFCDRALKKMNRAYSSSFLVCKRTSATQP
jgi:SAM-dependent methyltransferase